MSELKVYRDPKDGPSYREFYEKSEADKVIAEKDAVIAELKEIDSKNRLAYYKDLSMMAKDVEHQKYKRCLAMAKLCNEKWLVHNFAEITTKLGFYDKWEKRWRELAEEPTWARFLQLIRKEAK